VNKLYYEYAKARNVFVYFVYLHQNFNNKQKYRIQKNNNPRLLKIMLSIL